MKAIAGGAWLAGLAAIALGSLVGTIVLMLIGALAAAAAWYDEVLQERQAASWRANYPSYKY